MVDLIKFNIRNIFHQKLFYVCLILSLIMNPILSFVFDIILKSTENLTVMKNVISFMGSAVDIVMVIFIVLSSCFDFNEGTLKNVMSRGFTKKDYLLSKYIATLIGVFAIVLANIFLIFILFIKNGLGLQSNMILVLINSIISIIAITIFYTSLAIILEKNSTVIVGALLFPTVINMILNVISTKIDYNISRFWIENASEDFLTNQSLKNFGISFVIYLVYIIASYLICYELFKKKEIK